MDASWFAGRLRELREAAGLPISDEILPEVDLRAQVEATREDIVARRRRALTRSRVGAYDR